MEKSKKTNKRTKIFISLMLVLILLFSISFTYAWFTDKKESQTSVKFGKIALKITDDNGNKITTKTISFDVDRSYVAYQTGGKIMPGDKVGFKLNVGLESDSSDAYYLIKLKDSLNLFDNSMFFADGTKDSSGNLIVYQTDGLTSWVQNNTTQVVDKKVGKITKSDTHPINLKATIKTSFTGQGERTKVDCVIMAIQQAHLTETEALKLLNDGVNSLVPTGYTNVDYIKSTGLQYIDTGVKPTASMEFVGQMRLQRPTDSSDNYAFGSGSSYSNFTGLMLSTYPGIHLGLGNNSSLAGSIGTLEDWYDFDFDFQYNSKSASLNSNLLNTTKSYDSMTLNTENIYLFDRSTRGGKYGVVVYKFQIYSNDVLIRDFVPCLRDSDKVAGLYDLVNNEFYENIGTGSFSYA